MITLSASKNFHFLQSSNLPKAAATRPLAYITWWLTALDLLVALKTHPSKDSLWYASLPESNPKQVVAFEEFSVTTHQAVKTLH